MLLRLPVLDEDVDNELVEVVDFGEFVIGFEGILPRLVVVVVV
jgi:hypothetical protein